MPKGDNIETCNGNLDSKWNKWKQRHDKKKDKTLFKLYMQVVPDVLSSAACRIVLVGMDGLLKKRENTDINVIGKKEI